MNTLIAIGGLAVLVLIAEIINLRKFIIPITVIGLLGILGLTINDFGLEATYFNNMVVVNNFSTAFNALFIVLTIFLVVLSGDFYKNQYSKLSDYISLKLFLLMGAVSMVTFGNMAMFFLGLEILSISLYILAGSNRKDIRSNEAGMKYFLLGSFASGLVLFGIAFIYGATGTFDIGEIFKLSLAGGLPQWYQLGVLLMVVGMLFKIAAVPFHFWAPDVYQGAPTLTTTLMSTLAKVVAVATLYKLSVVLTPTMPQAYTTAIIFISILTMSVGNIMALRQGNIKRLLAYSGISHAGFMMMALTNLSQAESSLFYYATAYAIAGIAAFTVVLVVCRGHKEELIEQFNGLHKRNPLLAAVMSIALLSMGGIPIFAGFFGKFFLFTQALDKGYITLVIFGVLNSIISIYYYFKVILAMYTKEVQEDALELEIPLSYKVVGVITVLINIIIGLYPSFLLDIF